jgi:hypothetical protein
MCSQLKVKHLAVATYRALVQPSAANACRHADGKQQGNSTTKSNWVAML